MQWRDPKFLWLLVAVVALAVALVALLRRRAQQLRLFAAEPLVARLTPDLDARRRTWRIGLRLSTLAILAVTLAGPKWGFEWREVKREGIDLIVALDTSRSMLAADVKPNRLERAKLAIQDMVQLLDGDRVGLVAFAGTAFLQCPLTVDYAAFEASLRATNVGIIPRGGTALERAIDTSLAAFEAGEGKHQAVILITDGEDHEGDPEKAAERAAERGVKVYTVGIGTADGDLVPAGEGASGFLKDRKGQVVKTRLSEDALEKIAIKSDGAYVHGGGPSLGLDEVFRDHIAKMEKREVASSLERLYEERFQIPLVVVLLLVFAESWIGERKPAAARRRLRLPRPRLPFRRPGDSGAAARGAAELGAVVLLLAFTPSLLGWLDPRGDRAAEGNRLYEQGKYDEAASKYGDGLVDAPGSPLLQFNLGTALYKQGKYEEAIGPLSKVAASTDPTWTARASYNLGNAFYRLAAGAEESDPQAAIGHYEQALAAYKRAMGAAPQDPDPKFNHELVSRKLDELKKRLEEEKKKQEEEKEKQEQQDQAQQDQQEQQDQQDQQEQDQQEQDQQQQQDQQQAQDQQQQGEEQKQEEQQQDQQGEQQAGEQPEEEPQQDQDQQQAGGEQQPPSDEQQGEQAQAGGGQPMGEPSEEQNPDQQAAQAVLDMAGQEELRPEDMHRQMGVAGVGEPLQDW